MCRASWGAWSGCLARMAARGTPTNEGDASEAVSRHLSGDDDREGASKPRDEEGAGLGHGPRSHEAPATLSQAIRRDGQQLVYIRGCLTGYKFIQLDGGYTT